jgi:hypothetical protein
MDRFAEPVIGLRVRADPLARNDDAEACPSNLAQPSEMAGTALRALAHPACSTLLELTEFDLVGNFMRKVDAADGEDHLGRQLLVAF